MKLRLVFSFIILHASCSVFAMSFHPAPQSVANLSLDGAVGITAPAARRIPGRSFQTASALWHQINNGQGQSCLWMFVANPNYTDLTGLDATMIVVDAALSDYAYNIFSLPTAVSPWDGRRLRFAFSTPNRSQQQDQIVAALANDEDSIVMDGVTVAGGNSGYSGLINTSETPGDHLILILTSQHVWTVQTNRSGTWAGF